MLIWYQWIKDKGNISNCQSILNHFDLRSNLTDLTYCQHVLHVGQVHMHMHRIGFHNNLKIQCTVGHYAIAAYF